MQACRGLCFNAARPPQVSLWSCCVAKTRAARPQRALRTRTRSTSCRSSNKDARTHPTKMCAHCWRLRPALPPLLPLPSWRRRRRQGSCYAMLAAGGPRRESTSRHRPCNTMWYPSTCLAMGFANVRAGTRMQGRASCLSKSSSPSRAPRMARTWSYCKAKRSLLGPLSSCQAPEAALNFS